MEILNTVFPLNENALEKFSSYLTSDFSRADIFRVSSSNIPSRNSLKASVNILP